MFSLMKLFLSAAFFLDPLAVAKMEKNAKKAVEEHKKKETGVYFLPEKSQLKEVFYPALSFQIFTAEKQGVRPAMEDAHFFQEIEEGIFLGVLDGHGGKEVAEYASAFLQNRFKEVFRQTERNIHQTFTRLIDEIHQEVAKRKEWFMIGTTAVLCFIDKYNHQIYTATVGDSEANLYREVGGKLMSIPLSCVRDWSCPKEAKRAATFLGSPQIAIDWPKVSNPKHLRYPKSNYGINLSRAIGDMVFAGAVIHKPKITLQQVEVGDILILACDGLKDYVLESEIITQIKQKGPLAKGLVDFALKVKQSQDNITVLTLYIN